MDWTKVITDPLGVTGFALALVFGVAGRILARKRRKSDQWIVPAAYLLAVVCVGGGFFLAYKRGSVTTESRPPAVSVPAPSMRIDKIEQKADNGAAVAGVQGDVTVNKPTGQKESKPQH
jgi:hypothetical protein